MMIYEKTIKAYIENVKKINNYLNNGNQSSYDKIGYRVAFNTEDGLILVIIRCIPTYKKRSHMETYVWQDGTLINTFIRGKNFTDDYKFQINDNKYIIHIQTITD